jgi:hypothetical protein
VPYLLPLHGPDRPPMAYGLINNTKYHLSNAPCIHQAKSTFVRYVRCLPLYFSAIWLYEFSIAILPFLLSHSIELCYLLSWIVNGPILVHSRDFQNAVLRINQWKTNESLTQQHLPSLYPCQATLSCEIIIKPLISKAWIELSRSKLNINLIKLRQ